MSVDPISALPSRPSPGAAGARLAELYAEHSRMVYGVCRMLLRDPNEAEDATQQVFLSAYTNLLTGTDVRDPAAWLGTIARNACRRRAVARMREPLAVDDELTLVSPGVEEAVFGREEAAALYAELAVLPEKQREAVVLRDLYGLRYDEVATALGTSRPAVEALLFRGRRRLRRRLTPGFAAGVLVVPLAVQESIAYAVPGFASTSIPAGAVMAAAGVPLLAKLAAAGAAVGIAGSAGVVAERSFHDPPTRPAHVRNEQLRSEQVAPLAAADSGQSASFLPIPTGGFPIVRRSGGGEGGSGGDREQADSARVAGAVDDNDRNEERGKTAEDATVESSSESSGTQVDSEGKDTADAEQEADVRDPEDELGSGSGSGSGDGEREQHTLDD